MWAAAGLLVLALGAIAPAPGTIDANGRWSVRAEGTSGLLVNVTCLADFAQSGTSLAVTGSCDLAGDVSLAGTFDPAAGTFTASGHSEYYCSTLTIAGTVAADGRSFTGRFDCRGAFPVSGTFVGSRSRCGDGQLDAGEQCDDGNRVDGDCCSSSCTFEAVGGSCTDDGNPCTDDRCDGAGSCTHDPRADGFACDTGNDCVLSTCAQGVCVAGPPAPAGTSCAGASDPCGDNVCDGAGACTPRPKPDGNPCNDGNDCTLNDTCQAGVCQGTPMSCGSCQGCYPRVGCISISAPGCPAPKPVRVPVTCRDGMRGAMFEDFGGPICTLDCDVDGRQDSVCTFRIPNVYCGGGIRTTYRVFAVPVGRRRSVRRGSCPRPGVPILRSRLILHCRPHRQVPVCSLPGPHRER